MEELSKEMRALADETIMTAPAEVYVSELDEKGRLSRRVAALEMVIAEELDPSDCVDDANAMLVEEIHKRGATHP